jgi:two-component system, chemotaxis family, protein-glutamate methylesterase/glutaminase
MINAERIVRDVIVIGASAGGVQALLGLLGRLPDALPAAVAIVLHRSPFHETRLPWVLGRRTRLRVVEPSEGDPVEHGTVYVAPRDRHLVFRDGTVRMDGGPREHRTRPAIDPLFRTAAAFYGPRVVGVLLSGMGGDGVSGLMHIKAQGGLSMVQSPAEAQFSVMPVRAINEDDVDGVLPVGDLAEALTALAAGQVFAPAYSVPAPERGAASA